MMGCDWLQEFDGKEGSRKRLYFIHIHVVDLIQKSASVMMLHGPVEYGIGAQVDAS